VRIPNLLLSLLLLAGLAAAGEEPLPVAADLQGVEWRWQGSLYNDDTEAVPPAPDHYTLGLGEGGVFQVRADCNRASGGYVVDGKRLALTLGPTTLATCPAGSLDAAYLKDLSSVQSWMFDAGDLVLMLKYDTGTMRFSAGE